MCSLEPAAENTEDELAMLEGGGFTKQNRHERVKEICREKIKGEHSSVKTCNQCLLIMNYRGVRKKTK